MKRITSKTRMYVDGHMNELSSDKITPFDINTKKIQINSLYSNHSQLKLSSDFCLKKKVIDFHFPVTYSF